jgi:hypothetical protein
MGTMRSATIVVLLTLLFITEVVCFFSSSPFNGQTIIGIQQHATPPARTLLDSTSSTWLLARKNDDNDNPEPSSNWLVENLQKSNIEKIRQDALLVSTFVLARKISHLRKSNNHHFLLPLYWYFIGYWTMAGLLTKSFQGSRPLPLPLGIGQTMVNIALCCPFRIATEHLLEFGPSDMGGSTLEMAIASGFDLPPRRLLWFLQEFSCRKGDDTGIRSHDQPSFTSWPVLDRSLVSSKGGRTVIPTLRQNPNLEGKMQRRPPQ